MLNQLTGGGHLCPTRMQMVKSSNIAGDISCEGAAFPWWTAAGSSPVTVNLSVRVVKSRKQIKTIEQHNFNFLNVCKIWMVYSRGWTTNSQLFLIIYSRNASFTLSRRDLNIYKLNQGYD